MEKIIKRLVLLGKYYPIYNTFKFQYLISNLKKINLDKFSLNNIYYNFNNKSINNINSNTLDDFDDYVPKKLTIRFSEIQNLY